MTVHTPISTAEALRELRETPGRPHPARRRGPRRSTAPTSAGLVDRLPGAVARCTSAEEVAEVVRFCRERKIPIAPRGQAHTQSGQATTEGGVLLDTS